MSSRTTSTPSDSPAIDEPSTNASHTPPPESLKSIIKSVASGATANANATSWAINQAKIVIEHSKASQIKAHKRYRPLQLLDDEDSDDEWDGEAQGVPSFIHRASDTTITLARSLLEREQMTCFFQSSWIFLLLLGVLTSVTVWIVDAGVLTVTRLRLSFTELGGDWSFKYLFFVLFRVSMLLLSVGCTVAICPEAAGSGIPEMRSILGGFSFPKYLTARALIAKCFGLVLALGSGLTIGKVGPFVHLSSIIAHQLLQLPLFEQIRTSEDLSHDMLAAACAVGVTATFGAPVGGVLFSIEVTTTYYMTSNYWRAFFSSVVSVVVFRALNSFLAGSYGSLFTTNFDTLPYETFEIALFLLLAIICGLLAALLVRSYCLTLRLKKKFEDQFLHSCCGQYPRLLPFVYAALVACLFSLVEYPVGSFMQLTQRQAIDDMLASESLAASSTATHLSLDFGSSWKSPSLALNLLAYAIVRFWALAISATVLVPSGIVTPVFAIGAALGRLFGEFIFILSKGELSIGGYAVVGAASFTAGVTGTISIAVIVFELTGQLSYMIPVLLCVIVGRAVTRFFSLDMYETMSRHKKLPQWPDLTKQLSYTLTAGDLMREIPTYFLVRRQTLASLKQLLQATSRTQKDKTVRLFPVVDDIKTLILLGVATREELEALVVLWELSLHSEKDTHGRVSIAGILLEQAAILSNPATENNEVVDLVDLELLSLEDEHFHVPRGTCASHIILLISVHKCPQFFVTHRGKLQGIIHVADLLASSRKFTL